MARQTMHNARRNSLGNAGRNAAREHSGAHANNHARTPSDVRHRQPKQDFLLANTIMTNIASITPPGALRRSCQLLAQLVRLPHAHLVFERAIAPAVIADTYRYFTKRHPTYKVIQHKSWGAALIDLAQCASVEAYLERIKGKNHGAYFVKRARARGYVVRAIDRNDHVDAIHDINTSAPARQGRPMDDKYLRKQERYDNLPNFRYFGVFDAQGKLVAYSTLGWYGNFSAFGQLMGYRNNDGMMHLMIADVVATLINEQRVQYLMYDTFFGALPGLQQFKTILGFEPYRAIYRLQ